MKSKSGYCLKQGGKHIKRAIQCVSALLSLGVMAAQAGAQVPDLGIGASLHGKAVFPANNPWNQDISQQPVDPNSATLISSIGLAKFLHPDFGTFYNGAPIGIPYIVVPGTQPLVPMTFDYFDQSDPGPYPFPANAPIEGGSASTGDRHVLVVDRDNWLLYETWNSFLQADGSWHAGSGARFDLNSNNLRPQGWTSADAAGLPIFPGLVRYDEVMEQGVINHALRFTINHTRSAYTYPARHSASNLTGPSYAPMGMRVRLKAGYDISGFSASIKVILTALKKYGMIVADNGSDWFLSGAHDPRWDDNALNTLKQVPGSAFEVVQMGDIITDTVAPPTHLQAVPGNASVSLTWTGSAGAASYNVRSTTVVGGAFNTVANVAGTAATVNGLANGTTYYFVVTAVNTTGQSTNSNMVTVTPVGGVAQVSLTGVSLSAASQTGGNTVQGTISLSGPAPAGGASIALSSTNSAAASVPVTVTVPAGASSVGFTVQTAPVDASTPVTITANYLGANKTASLQVLSPILSGMGLSVSSVKGGGSVNCTVGLSGNAGPSGCVIAFSSSSAFAVVPPSVKIPAGSRFVRITIPTSAVLASTNVTITAVYGATLSRNFTITP